MVSGLPGAPETPPRLSPSPLAGEGRGEGATPLLDPLCNPENTCRFATLPAPPMSAIAKTFAKTLAIAALLGGLLALPPALAQSEPAPAAAKAPVQSIYDEGKKLYDAGDYAGARSKFAEAARREPENARWFYNLGLAQRQLDNYQAARQAFLRARELNPEYKKKEIDEKLASMGFDPGAAADAQPRSLNSVQGEEGRANEDGVVNLEQAPAEEESDFSGLIVFIVMTALLVGISIFVLRRTLASGKPSGKASVVNIDHQAIAAAREKLQAVGAQLIPIEHAMRLGENADLRSLLEHATLLEAAARQELEKAKQGNTSSLRKAQQHIAEAGSSARQATELATRLYGDQAFADKGERIGCFFCARPLANAEVRQPVGMKHGAETDTVISCPDCAAQAARGEAPRIRTGNGQQQHWSDDPDFDPYTARHSDGPARRVPAWDFRPMQPVSTLAQQAGGAAMLGVGAFAGAGAAMAASHLLDLDALRAAEQTQKAAGETANRVRERNSNNSDHS